MISETADHLPRKLPLKLAIVGGGPAGMTAAFDLARAGHQVSVYESQSHAGGMTRYGIPEYRLPYDALDRDVDLILSMGVEIHYNTRVGHDVSMEELHQNFDAVVLAIGLQLGRSTRIPGSDHPSVHKAVDLLRRITQGDAIQAPKSMVVIGGGNVAMDIARSLALAGMILFHTVTDLELFGQHCPTALVSRKRFRDTSGGAKTVHQALVHRLDQGVDFQAPVVVVHRPIPFAGRFPGASGFGNVAQQLAAQSLAQRQGPCPGGFALQKRALIQGQDALLAVCQLAHRQRLVEPVQQTLGVVYGALESPGIDPGEVAVERQTPIVHQKQTLQADQLPEPVKGYIEGVLGLVTLGVRPQRLTEKLGVDATSTEGNQSLQQLERALITGLDAAGDSLPMQLDAEAAQGMNSHRAVQVVVNRASGPGSLRLQSRERVGSGIRQIGIHRVSSDTFGVAASLLLCSPGVAGLVINFFKIRLFDTERRVARDPELWTRLLRASSVCPRRVKYACRGESRRWRLTQNLHEGMQVM